MATTALSATQPKCLPRSAQALAAAAVANITAVVATIQCRAGSDAIQGAAINSTPPPIHATVPACHTARSSVRSRGGSMVARLNTRVSPTTPWDQRHYNRGGSGTLQQQIAHRLNLHTGLYGVTPDAGG